MKRFFLLPLAAALGLWAADPPHQPHAWGDKDKDGKCDSTGKPVGQHRLANQQGDQKRQHHGKGRGRQRAGRGHGHQHGNQAAGKTPGKA